MLGAMVGSHHARTFLIQLTEGPDDHGTPPKGRIEHVDSGVRGRFTSEAEMWAFVRRILAQQGAEESEP